MNLKTLHECLSTTKAPVIELIYQVHTSVEEFHATTLGEMQLARIPLIGSSRTASLKLGVAQHRSKLHGELYRHTEKQPDEF